MSLELVLEVSSDCRILCYISLSIGWILSIQNGGASKVRSLVTTCILSILHNTLYNQILYYTRISWESYLNITDFILVCWTLRWKTTERLLWRCSKRIRCGLCNSGYVKQVSCFHFYQTSQTTIISTKYMIISI